MPVYYIEVEGHKYQLFIFPGNQDLCVSEGPPYHTWHPSVLETLPDEYPDLKCEFGKLETQLFDRPKRRAQEPLTRVIADANDRSKQMNNVKNLST